MQLCGRIFKKMPPTPFCPHPAPKSLYKGEPLCAFFLSLTVSVSNEDAGEHEIILMQTHHCWIFILRGDKSEEVHNQIASLRQIRPTSEPSHKYGKTGKYGSLGALFFRHDDTELVVTQMTRSHSGRNETQSSARMWKSHI